MKTVKNAMLIFSVLVFVACDQTQKSDNSTTTTQESRVEQVQTSPLSKTTISRTIDLSTTLQGYET
ncbi:MAG TPA: hypothetical protein P5564_07185, partial [Paludibacteraceae bacterium]|nr:hypothetical protein [Paludibacteraceae bacterium]